MEQLYSAAAICTVAPVTVAAEYPQTTLAGTPTCSSQSSTVLYETYVAGQRNLDVYKQVYLVLL